MELKLEAYCECGEELTKGSDYSLSLDARSSLDTMVITVSKCKKCAQSNYDEGHEVGADEGYARAEQDHVP